MPSKPTAEKSTLRATRSDGGSLLTLTSHGMKEIAGMTDVEAKVCELCGEKTSPLATCGTCGTPTSPNVTADDERLKTYHRMVIRSRGWREEAFP